MLCYGCRNKLKKIVYKIYKTFCGFSLFGLSIYSMCICINFALSAKWYNFIFSACITLYLTFKTGKSAEDADSIY